ncbi:MAG: polysaccharide pyruvyl transferase family protein, partial [Hyphomonas sp.]
MNIFKRWLTDLAAWLGRCLRSDRTSGRALIIPPAVPGSMGDAAMITSTIAALRGMGFVRVDVLQLAPGADWNVDSRPDRLIPGWRFIDYGSVSNLAELLVRLGSYTHVFCIGADILDGIYDEDRMARRLELLSRAARSGAEPVILGSSFSEHPSPRIVGLIRKLPEEVAIFARDRYSKARMDGALDRRIGLSADVVFLLEPAHPIDRHAEDIAWLEDERASGRRLVGLNANYLNEKDHPGLVGGYSGLLTRLVSAGCSVLLVPHDTRTERSDLVICQTIFDSLAPDVARHARVLIPTSPGQLRSVLDRVDLVVTGRMHAAIIALGGTTPAMSFAYANKFEGLYRHLGLEPGDMILSLAQLEDDPEAVTASILAVLTRSPELR